VIERGGRIGLLLETAQEIRLGGERGGQDFDGGEATGQAEMPGGIDLAHPATPEQPFEAI
jgi:hypothetical protein